MGEVILPLSYDQKSIVDTRAPHLFDRFSVKKIFANRLDSKGSGTRKKKNTKQPTRPPQPTDFPFRVF